MTKRLISVAGLGLVLLACSPNPTGEEVIEKVAPTVCEKAKECYGEAAFNAAFPNGQSECVTKSKDAVKAKRGDDLDQTSTCTDDEVDKCIADLKAAACKADKSLPDVPCNC